MKQMRYLLIAFMALAVPAQAQDSSWNSTIDRIATAIVSIRVDSTRSFDTERNQSSQATGFVVDAERGLVLTNRHVVTPGPVRAKAIFLNQEEVDLVPVYRDPVHDFGFFRYDPSSLQFIQPEELALVPDAAQIGRDIRVIGNDAGEQLSILAGTIARIDRQAPNYGRGNYNDFNTFYLQAASGTSGGSSGSPVIDIEGRVVALNAGAANQAASSFFLPLNRVQVALASIQADEVVARGTLQTEFVHQPYAELRRLGLHRDTEARMRNAFPDKTGLLVVQQVMPGSTAAGSLRPGDILIEVGGEPIADFVRLAELLDSGVGEPLSLVVERGGTSIEQQLMVDDLHAITPREFIEYGDGILNNLSYQQARHYYRPIEGVYVANPGYVLGTAAIPRSSLIIEFDRKPISNLNDLEAAIRETPAGAQVVVRFVTLEDPQSERQRVIINDRDWFRSVRCSRDDSTGLWPCNDLELTAAEASSAPRQTTFDLEGERNVREIIPSLVLVNFSMPYTVSGVSDRYYYGSGLVVDAERGWVVVDRNTVPVAIGDVRITFAGSLEVPGRVEYIHPLHNLAVVSYDPELIGDTPVQSAALSEAELSAGDDVTVVGLAPDHRVMSQSSEVAALSQATFPLSRTVRFRESNLETVTLVNGPTDFDGVVVDEQGRALALWASFAYQTGRDMTQVNMGIPAGVVGDMIGHLQAGSSIRSLEIEWLQTPISAARKINLPESWARQYEDDGRRQLLAVSTVVAGAPAETMLRSGDIVLSMNGDILNSFREVELASQRAAVAMTILRDGQELELNVPTVELDGYGINRVVLWAGALLQAPHRELAAQRGISRAGVYVSYFNFGSPASRSQLFAGRRIVAVDGQPTADLDQFVAAVNGLPDGSSVRINTVTWNNVPEVITLELDEQYWPSYQLARDEHNWIRSPL